MQSNFQETHETQAARKQPSRFVEHMQQMFGEEPDPIFMEESWRLGVVAATENLHRRQKQQMLHEDERRTVALRELGRIAGLRSGTKASSEAEELGWMPSGSTGADWVPADWTPADQVVQRALPHGWMPMDVPPQETHWQQAVGEMSREYAEEMLGVTAADSREEIRSAYRRMVGMCHPDRYHDAGEAVRERATRQMAELNEAYRMMCESLMEQAA
jgi:DnaJ-domain-containing protein 1